MSISAAQQSDLVIHMFFRGGFPGGTAVKSPPANAGSTRVVVVGSVPGSERSPGVGNGNPSSILAWKTPWTEKPGGLQSMGLQRVGHN